MLRYRGRCLVTRLQSLERFFEVEEPLDILIYFDEEETEWIKLRRQGGRTTTLARSDPLPDLDPDEADD